MAPSHKVTNGRSPLVNKQYQITSFFTKADSSLPKSKPQLSPPKSKQTPFPKSQNPNPNPNISPGSSPPTTPSPINAKSKSKSTPKPLLVIGSQKSSPAEVNLKGNLFGEEVVNRRIRVYWPMDEAWYEGCVNSFDKVSGKHLVEYDDGEEEMIDLSKEKIEWIEVEGGSCVKKSRKRRLRKVSIVVDDEEEKEGEGNVGPVEDDSSDEDWGKNVVVEEEDRLEEMDLVDEEEEKEVESLKRKRGKVGGSEAKKNSKEGDGEAANSSKKKKVEVCVFGSKPVKPVAKVQEAKSHNVLDSTTTDASAESGSEAEDIASPKAAVNYSHLRLTPVREEVKVTGKTAYAGSYSGYDEYVPMVDKPVDAGWKKQSSIQRSFSSKATLPLADAKKTPKGIRDRVMMVIVAFFMTLLTIFRSLAGRVTKKLPDASPIDELSIKDVTLDTVPQESRPPSPPPAFTETDLMSNVLKRLGELEEKVGTLQSKPSEMPYEKEELLNAAVCRVDALEAELIATKKALHEALMRQEELLAYIDRQEAAKYQKKKFCW